MYLSNRMRLARTMEGLFLKTHPDTPLFSNMYSIEWLTSNQGVVVNIKKIARLQTDTDEEVIQFTPKEVTEFKEFSEVFSVCFMYSQKTKLKKLKKLKSYTPTTENLKYRFTANLLISEGIATTFKDIIRTKRVNHPEFLPF